MVKGYYCLCYPCCFVTSLCLE